jgi:hypothetical protein
MKKKARKLQLTKETLIYLQGGTDEGLTGNTEGSEQATGSECTPDCITNMILCPQKKTVPM